jgi:signal transduction histidine kinase
MKQRIKRLKYLLVGSEGAFILEERMLLAALLIGIIVAVIGSGMNFFLGYSLVAFLIPIILVVVLVFLYHLIRFRHKPIKPLVMVSLLCFSGLGAIWIFNGGYNGTNSFVLITAFVLVLSIIPSSKFRLVYIFFISLLLALYFFHYLFPEYIVNFPDEKTRFIDATITIFYTSTFIYLMITFLLRNYRLERKRSNERGAKLEELNRELILSNTSKNKLLSIIAHDLKNPFNTILGFSELSQASLMKGNYRESAIELEQCIISARKTLVLLDNLLLWAGSQSHQIKFNPELFDLHPQIHEIIETFEASAKSKHISLIGFRGNATRVYADRDMLHVIIRNLVSNAIKFTDPGGKVRVWGETNHNLTEINISDTGVGIDAHSLKFLLGKEPVSSTAGTENEKGSGLGLVLCREFVDYHKGEIRVESKPGEGTRFTILLPFPRQG